MGFCDGGLCQKAAVWTKSGHTLPLLCTASESSLGPPWWHISPCHRPFPSTLSLPREIWLDLTERCHWYTLQQSYINLPKLQSITLCKAASAIWIAEMEKKKFYRSLPVLKVVLFWVVCLFLRRTELAFLVVLILDKRTLHFQRKEGYVQAVQTLIPQRFAHLVKISSLVLPKLSAPGSVGTAIHSKLARKSPGTASS